MDWQPAFGHVLRKWRKTRGLSQAELGKRVGRLRGTVIGWEKGRHFPSRSDIHATLKILGAKPEEFFEEVGARWGALLVDASSASELPGPRDPVSDATEMRDANVPETIDPPTAPPRNDPRPEHEVLIQALELFIERTIDRRSS